MGQVSESEWQTRKSRIDASLQAAGWAVVPFQQGQAATWQRHAVEEHPTANGPADYALFVEGLLLGVVEAKKLSLGPQNVLIQAERYARGADPTHFDFRGQPSLRVLREVGIHGRPKSHSPWLSDVAKGNLVLLEDAVRAYNSKTGTFPTLPQVKEDYSRVAWMLAAPCRGSAR